MENNQKYNKRRRSYTEFRTSYSDNKDYFISTDRKGHHISIVKYIIIAVALIFFTLAGFLITDALLNISEEPYNREETTVEKESQTYIDQKYFDNIVTRPADENDDSSNNNSAE